MPKEHKYPGVTRVLEVLELFEDIGGGLQYWRGKYGNRECERYLKACGDFGTQLHKMLEHELKGEEIPPSTVDPRWLDQIYDLTDLGVQWVKETGFEPVAFEVPFEDDELEVRGRIDVVGRFPGEPYLTVGDWKTSSKLGLSVKMQTAAYIRAWNKLDDKRGKAAGGFALRFEKNPEKKPLQSKFYSAEEMEEALEDFKAARRLYKRIHKK